MTKLAFDWHDYLRLAQALALYGAEDELHEAAWRSAVSRAYYATFCHVLDHERDHRSFEPKGRGDHGGLRNHLKRTHKRRHAMLLFELQEWRETCDYDDEPVAYELVEKAISRANEIIALF